VCIEPQAATPISDPNGDPDRSDAICDRADHSAGGAGGVDQPSGGGAGGESSGAGG
jgi:hypothetical protein